jgi:Putative beta-barrel porin 2
MLMRPRSAVTTLVAVVASLVAPGFAAAAESLSYGVDAGIGQTDNVSLVSTDKISQTLAVTDLDFDIKHQSKRLDLDAKGNFSYIDYLQNAYNSQFVGRFDGTANIGIIPDRLTWAIQDNYGQAALDPFTATIPTNLEDINYFSTGPDLVLHPSATTFVNIGARYTRTTYETSPFNSNRLLGDLAWGLDLSAQSRVSLHGETEQVNFENTVLNTDYIRNSVFVRYELRGARTEVSADLGATNFKEGNDSTNGGLGRISLTRQVSPAAKLIFSLGHELTDASSSFSNPLGGATGVIGTAPAAQTSNNYKADHVSLMWQYQRNRTTIALSGRWEKDSYVDETQFDNSRYGGEFSVEHKLTHALSAQLFGRLYKTDYPHALVTTSNASSNYNESQAGAGLTWRHGRALEVRLRYQHDARVAEVTAAGYRENRVLLTVGYRPEARRPNGDSGA